MVSNLSIFDLEIKNTVDDNDSVVMTIGGTVARIKISTLKSILKQWNDIINKPFDNINSSGFEINNNTLSLSSDVTNALHTHQNKAYLDKIGETNEGKMTYDNSLISSEWDDVENKPFNTLSNDFTVSNNVISVSDTLKSQLHEHTNKTVLDKLSESNGQLLYDGTEISGNMPEIEIDDNGEWTIEGVSTGKTSRGDNGITPNIDSTTKHWMLGETDTGITAEGEDGFSPSISLTETADGVEIEITNKDSIQTTTITNGITTIQTEKLDLTCTILAENWSNTLPYTQTVTVNGITEDVNPRIDILVSDDITTGIDELDAWGCITKAITVNGSITFYCYKNKPDIDLNVMIEVI